MEKREPRKISKEELEEILRLNKMWVNNEALGKELTT